MVVVLGHDDGIAMLLGRFCPACVMFLPVSLTT